MGCKICEEAKKEGYVWLGNRVVRLDFEQGFYDACLVGQDRDCSIENIEIFYCPFCGEKLSSGEFEND